MLTVLLGGMGLFLLGMWLMTDGLKLAAGAMLRTILASWTNTPLRGLLTGVGVTATVQSSSAVTVATVGFVNAGLLTLTQAVWVIYGSNIGTTMTGWIVASTGVEVKLDAYALPAVGIGMLLRLTSPRSRRAAYGQALAGFAVFLLGIQALKSGFSDLATSVDLGALPSTGWQSVGVYFAIGAVLTFLVQSSSATTAIAISATAGGLVPVEHAALVIIGAALGTSSTAMLAALGATANARRAAASHVCLNVVTVTFAITALHGVLASLRFAQSAIGLSGDPALTVAAFSTVFNATGVLLMIPLTRPMVRMLERRFLSGDEDLARPRHIDATLLEVPELAVRGLVLEVQRLGGACLELAAATSSLGTRNVAALERRKSAIDTLADQIRTSVGLLNRASLPTDVADDLPALLRALQHYEEVADLALAGASPEPIPTPWFTELRPHFAEATRVALAATDTAADGFDTARLQQAVAEAEAIYERLKTRLLYAAADASLPVGVMEDHMQDIGRLHHATERAVRAAQRLARHRPQAVAPQAA